MNNVGISLEQCMEMMDLTSMLHISLEPRCAKGSGREQALYLERKVEGC